MSGSEGNNEKPRILCVDDEPNLLQALGRTLGRQFEVHTAEDAARALEKLRTGGPFAAVMSDLRMPGMDGITFLGNVREEFPDTVRVLLTGKADFEAAIQAVNKGRIFRFLQKPCPADVLGPALEAAAEQHRLITAERVLLEQTLVGSIQTLADVLSLVQPAAFGRAMRVRKHVEAVADQVGAAERWTLEAAAMLSQIASVTLPPATLGRVHAGESLSEAERRMVDRGPEITQQLLAHIPRLEPVRRALLYQDKNWDGTGVPNDAVTGDKIPFGARLLHIALDFDALESQGMEPSLILDTLRGRKGHYEPALLETFAQRVGKIGEREVKELRLRDVGIGMVFAQDVLTLQGVLLIARGQEVGASLLERIRNLSGTVLVREPLRVVLPGSPHKELVGAGGAAGARRF